MWMWPTIPQQMLYSMKSNEDEFFKPMKVKGDGSCLYWTVASHIMSFFLNDVWTDRFPTRKKPGKNWQHLRWQMIQTGYLPERQ